MSGASGHDMPLWEHLEELRRTIFKCLAALLASTMLGFLFTGCIYRALLLPVRQYLSPEVAGHYFPGSAPRDTGSRESLDRLAADIAALRAELAAAPPSGLAAVAFQNRVTTLLERQMLVLRELAEGPRLQDRLRIVYSSPLDPFVTKLRIAFLGGVVFAVPFVCHFIWKFIQPGLARREKRLARRYVAFATVLFVFGGAFGYGFLPFGIPALMKFGAAGIGQIWPFKGYIAFCTRMVLAFALVFEMPLVLGALVRLEVLSLTSLSRGRPYAIVVILVVAALLTPPDVLSQIALAIPMMLLYEISILAGKIQRKRAASADRCRME